MSEIINIKEEVVNSVPYDEILCAIVVYKNKWRNAFMVAEYSMPIGSPVMKFLHHIDFEHDRGLSRQEVTGTIWLNDGSWYQRDAKDGWVYKKSPSIPDQLKGE